MQIYSTNLNENFNYYKGVNFLKVISPTDLLGLGPRFCISNKISRDVNLLVYLSSLECKDACVLAGRGRGGIRLGMKSGKK